MAHTITLEVAVQATYTVQLTAKDAKAIGGSYADPDEKWADEAKWALQAAFENADSQIAHAIRTGLPKSIDVRIDSQPARLSLASTDVDLDGVEVEQ